MNKTVPPISQPDLGDARQLTPLELNAMHYDVRHTVLTPEVLEQHRSGAASENP